MAVLFRAKNNPSWFYRKWYTGLPFFGRPRRPLRDFLSWCLSLGAFTNNEDSSPFCVPLKPFFRPALTPSITTRLPLFCGASFASSTAEVDLLRTRIFFVEAVGIVVTPPEEGELAIFTVPEREGKSLA